MGNWFSRFTSKRDEDITVNFDNLMQAQVCVKDVGVYSKRKYQETPFEQKPYTIDEFSDKIQLQWNYIRQLNENEEFQIVFTEAENVRWRTHDKTTTMDWIHITGLKAQTNYLFKVRVINAISGYEGMFSLISDELKTKQSRALAILNESVPAQENRMPIPIHDLPVKQRMDARNVTAKTRKFTLGDKIPGKEQTKTIMLVGATGSGKSTFINALVNYILGVTWEDDFRFNLVHLEDCEKYKLEEQSQTDWITCYSIGNAVCSRIQYSINLIDTPGFGDTRGLVQDTKIVSQIRTLFTSKGKKGVDILDAVCFLVKAPDSRLTITQRYIFESILSLFGNDIKDNICTVVTFADGQTPPVLAGIKAIPDVPLPYKIYFPFNNSALYANNTEKSHENFSSSFWNMGITSSEKLFDHIKNLPSKSLILTAEVLLSREALENTIANLQKELYKGMSKINTLEKEKHIFGLNKQAIEENKNFTYVVEEDRQEAVSIEGKGQYTTNCLECNFTCHENCAIPNNEDKSRCCAMKDGICTQCPKRCEWTKHKNTPFIIKLIKVKVKKTYDDMEKKYREANHKKLTQKQVIEKMSREIQDLDDQVKALLDNINTHHNRLKEIALRPNPLSTAEYIDLLIAGEIKEEKHGFQFRIDALERAKGRAQYNTGVAEFECRFKRTKT